jgi:hypothetical protein
MKHDTVNWLRDRSSNSVRRTFLFSPSRSDQHTQSLVNWLPAVKPQGKAVEAWSSLHISIYIFVVKFKMLFEFTDVWLTVGGWRLILWKRHGTNGANRKLWQPAHGPTMEFAASRVRSRSLTQRLSSYSFWLELSFSCLTLYHGTIGYDGLSS